MRRIADAGSFVATPSLWVMAWVAVCLTGGVITAAKGQWVALGVGFLLGGAIWPLTAFLRATPQSVWGRAPRDRRA